MADADLDTPVDKPVAPAAPATPRVAKPIDRMRAGLLGPDAPRGTATSKPSRPVTRKVTR